MSSVLHAFVVAPLLLYAVVNDVATRMISDRVSIFALIAGLLSRLALGPAPAAWSVLTAICVLLALLAPFGRGLIGGGDVKLVAALAAGFSPMQTLIFIEATVLAGGVLGLAYLLARATIRPLPLRPRASFFHRVVIVETRRLRRAPSLPYGAAIAFGAAIVFMKG